MSDAVRLERFRGAIARLDPTRPPRKSEEHAWYVNRPDHQDRQLTARFALEPKSLCAVVGPVGSGKSSTLLAVGRRLLKTPGVFARYLELSAVTDLSKATDRAIAVAVAWDVSQTLKQRHPQDESVKVAARFWSDRALGSWISADDWDDDQPEDVDGPAFHPGLVEPEPHPLPELQRRLKDLAEDVERLTHGVLVLLIDGLDRLPTLQRFEEIVEPLLGALRRAGIGAAVVSPWRSMLGADRVNTERRFDATCELSAIEAPTAADLGEGLGQPSTPGADFFGRLLTARAVDLFFEPGAVPALAGFSGGLLRDFFQLAKGALMGAWSEERDRASLQDVAGTADQLGRARLLGLTDEEFALLGEVHHTGRFAPRTPGQQALLATGRILQRREPGGISHARVHPTLVPFLPADAPAASAHS